MAQPKTTSKTLDEITRLELSIEQTIKLLKNQFRQVIKLGPKYQAAMYFLEGLPGIGKTSIMDQIRAAMAEEIKALNPETVYSKDDYNYFMNEQKGNGLLVCSNLSAQDAQDFSGQPTEPTFDKTTNKYVQHFSHPESKIPTRGYGIVFYDEANRVFDLSMKSTLLSMWMDRGVNGNYLGNGYIQVAAGNNFNDPRFQTVKPDTALSERYVIISVKPTFDEVIGFLSKKHETEDNSHFLLDYLWDHNGFCNLFGDYNAGFSPRKIDLAMTSITTVKDDYNTCSEAKFIIQMNLKLYFGSLGDKIIEILDNRQEITLSKILKDPTLINRIQVSDIPMMTGLAKDMFSMINDSHKVGKKLSKADAKIFDQIAPKINAEAKTCILDLVMNKSANGQPKELLSTLKEQCPELGKSLSSVSQVWETNSVRTNI